MKATIKQIADFYAEHPDCIGSLRVLGRNGYKTIEYADITAYDSEQLSVKTVDGKEIIGSPDHLLWVTVPDGFSGWVNLEKITPEMHLHTINGTERIKSVELLESRQDLYDLQVDGKEFYANGVVSHNSSMFEAICFSLYGKPYRDINKPQLINSINGKNCYVEIEFSIGRKKYLIKRGMKPSVFEIWCNGELINQDAASRDYQQLLEDQILKMNYRSFTQIVLLGTASFTPFMQLKASERREVIEELLDIKVFTNMRQVLKDRIAKNKQELQIIDGKIEVSKKKSQLQQQYITQLEQDRDSRLDELVQQKKAWDVQIKDLKTKRTDLEEQQRSLKVQLAVFDNIPSMTDAETKMVVTQRGLKQLEQEVDFYESHDVCPQCQQGIPHEFAEMVRVDKRDQITQMERELTDHMEYLVALRAKHTAKDRVVESLRQTESDLQKVQFQIETLQSQVKRVKSEYEQISQKLDSIENERNKLKEMAEEALGFIKERSDITERRQYLDAAEIMLKDSGIKTRIIKQYVPAINSMVNRYLNSMNFFVQFTLDEEFNEVIKSKYRDTFSYNSFSEGEKQRIDLALLFTWRQIAKMKHSANTNLLLLDEVFDSSLDDEGNEYIMALLKEFGKDTNVFVISHKGDKLKDKFKRTITFKSTGNFSEMES